MLNSLLLHLLAVLFSLPSSSPSASYTFKAKDPRSGATLLCASCPPGTFLRRPCSATQDSECAPCPSGSFTEVWNSVNSCLRCHVCEHNQRMKEPCTASANCKCECNEGFYLRQDFGLCERHSACPAGYGVVSKGCASNNTVCEQCSNGTFSDVFSLLQNCTEHRRCSTGLTTLLRGSGWHDTVCGDCRQLKDGALYLKDILPAFLVYQQMSQRRLRRVASCLPTLDGKRMTGLSNLDSDGIQQRIVGWAETATASQIRQLPVILDKNGANGAADRLEHKLQRIDAAISADCGLANEVENL